MTSRDFAFWLQGFMELIKEEDTSPTLNNKQFNCIQKHLSLVFKHEIDPSYGPDQTELNKIHGGFNPHGSGEASSGGPFIRC